MKCEIERMEIIYTFYFFCLFEKSDKKTIDILLLVEADGYKKLLITMSAKTYSCENLL